MQAQTIGATGTPPIIPQASAIRRRISASDSVVALVASLAFGEPRRNDVAAAASLTASRCSSSTGCHS